MAELWGLYEGLCIVRGCGVVNFEVQLDSEVVVRSLNEGKMGSAAGWSIIKKIKAVLDQRRKKFPCTIKRWHTCDGICLSYVLKLL